jgi:hypothetical protein
MSGWLPGPEPPGQFFLYFGLQSIKIGCIVDLSKIYTHYGHLIILERILSMKSVTEFAIFTLNKGLAAKAALAAEGKSPEEIQTSLGETFKLEGDKLKYFVNALDVAGQNQQNLKRVFVISLSEGESAPAKATQVEEFHYVPEFLNTVKPVAAAADAKGGRGKGGRGGGGGRGEKKGGSPWGMSPEEKAAKNKPKATT